MPEFARWILVVAFVSFGLYAASRMARALRSGTAASGDVHWPERAQRSEQPILFWLYVTGWFIGAISGLALGLLLLFAPALYREIV
jgi:hypothetical protein